MPHNLKWDADTAVQVLVRAAVQAHATNLVQELAKTHVVMPVPDCAMDAITVAQIHARAIVLHRTECKHS